MKYEKLPLQMQNDYVKKYYEILKKKKLTLFFKRMFDIIVSLIMIIVLIPLFLIISLLVLCTSKGPIFYRQIRVTKYCKKFKILKFRTMVKNADKIGSEVTIDKDPRITKVGRFLRKCRLDEIPQLFNIFIGDISFVGPRPEVTKYVERYSSEMYATLLVRAGVTCTSSIKFRNEAEILKDKDDVDDVYVNMVLPEKMEYNYEYIRKLSFFRDIALMIKTVFVMFKK